MDSKSKVLGTMKAAGEPLNACKDRCRQRMGSQSSVGTGFSSDRPDRLCPDDDFTKQTACSISVEFYA